MYYWQQPWKEPKEPFEEGKDYSPTELEAHADQILKADRKETGEMHGILDHVQMVKKLRHEIFNVNGVPDPGIFAGIYWRTHPQGIKTRTGDDKTMSYYRH